MPDPVYIPAGSTVWSGTEGNGGRADFRFVLSNISYNIGTNKTTLDVSLQVRFVNSSTWLFYYRFQSGSATIPGSTTTFNNDYYVRPTALNTWYDVLKTSDSTKKTWSVEVSHAANGSGSITLSLTNVNLYYYNSGNGYAYNIKLGGTYSGTHDLSQNRSYTLSISAGTGSTISVTCGGSSLSNGATINYGDVLTVTYGASSGYTLATHTVNGTTFTSGNTHTVTGNVAVAATATATGYTLTISPGANSSLTVKKNGTPLSSGATVYTGDVLSISATASSGYTISSVTVNGNAIANNSSYIVGAGTVAIECTAVLIPPVVTDGGVWLYVSGAWAEYQAYIYDNGAWAKVQPYIYINNGWVKS